MPSVEVSAPVSSVASERLVLGVGWVRQGAGGIGGAGINGTLDINVICCGACVACFEGNEE
jgi:hypothetical protein